MIAFAPVAFQEASGYIPHGTRQEHRPSGGEEWFFKVCTVQTAVVNGDLGGCTAVKAVEQLRILKEHCFLILTAGDSIVDVAELIGLGNLSLPT